MSQIQDLRPVRRRDAVANRAAIVVCRAVGLPPEVIARRLGLSRPCVYRHLQAILSGDKINLRETADALSRRAV